MILTEKKNFISFDRSVRIASQYISPDRYRHIISILQTKQKFIPRGSGLSYSACSFDSQALSISMKKFDRFLEFDNTKLQVTIESGITLCKLTEWSLKKGLYLPVMPGHSMITIGGCISANIHGKNPYKDGVFYDHLISLRFYHPSHGLLNCSRIENKNLFKLICGGFGLFGIILDATVQLKKIPSNYLKETLYPVKTFKDVSDFYIKNSTKFDLLYSWHDGTSRGTSLGKGFICAGSFYKSNKTAIYKKKSVQNIDNGNKCIQIWTYYLFHLINRFFYFYKKRIGSRILHVEDSFFPLEKKSIYFSLFGKNGFREVQFFINKEKFLLFIPLLENLINKINPPLIFISIKPIKCESFSLGVNGNGYLLALNFLNGKKFIAFTKQLDKLFIKYNCQPNLSKNSYLKKSVAKKTICNYLAFKLKLKSFDPKKKFQSHFSRRIGL